MQAAGSARAGSQQIRLRYASVVGLIGMADTMVDKDGVDGAIGVCTTALDLAVDVGYRMLEGQARTVLARIHLRDDRPDLAAQQAETALATHREIRHRLGEARAHAVIGHALLRLGTPDEALVHRRAALDLLTSIGAAASAAVRADLAAIAASRAPVNGEPRFDTLPDLGSYI
jgi:hypothetical protein